MIVPADTCLGFSSIEIINCLFILYSLLIKILKQLAMLFLLLNEYIHVHLHHFQKGLALAMGSTLMEASHILFAFVHSCFKWT